MKKLLYLLFVLVVAEVHAQSKSDKTEILDLLESQRQAWNKGDLEGYMQGYWKSDSLMFVGSRGPTFGWQQTMDNYKKGYPDKAAMGTLTFSIQKVEFLSGNAAFVLGGWNLKRDKDAPGGYFTLILKKIKGAWKVVADHSS